MGKERVCYFYEPDVAEMYYGNKHPMKPHRMTMTHHLVLGYQIHEHMDVYRPRRLAPEEFLTFHSEAFINYLQIAESLDRSKREVRAESRTFGISEDCPIFPGMFEFCRFYAGASVEGANKLNAGQYDVAINWAGGLHHSKRGEASGFCYVNDLVLAIIELLRVHARVLYIDIDIHHGDGVEEAFYLTDRVMTCSFHKHGGGFFPGTGALDDIGEELGRGYSVNVPLNEGVTDRVFLSLFRPIMDRIIDVFQPGAIVLQCGADSLAADRLGCFMLTIQGHCEAVKHVAGYGIPLLVTGGGGYTKANVARCWANETAALARVDIDPKLPHTMYNEYFRDDPTLLLKDLGGKRIDNFNKPAMVEELKTRILQQLETLRAHPGVGTDRFPDKTMLKNYLQLRNVQYADAGTFSRTHKLLADHLYFKEPSPEGEDDSDGEPPL